MLLDNAAVCPLGTDTVENLHGPNQYNLLAWRGSSKGVGRAAETSVLSMLNAEHAHLKSLVLGEKMPSKRQLHSMRKQVGNRKPANKPVTSSAKRLLLASQIKPRKLSAWNVFRREKLKAVRRQMSKEEYGEQCKATARQRGCLSEEERANYRLQASYEQCCRDELSERPLLAGRA